MAERADKITGKSLQDVFFSDFMNSFRKHPETGALNRITNETSVKQAIKNLVLTTQGERPFQPLVGGNVRAQLFEPANPFSATALQTHIQQVIFNNEKRVSSCRVDVDIAADQNAYEVTIYFTIHNKPEVSSKEMTLQRNR